MLIYEAQLIPYRIGFRYCNHILLEQFATRHCLEEGGKDGDVWRKQGDKLKEYNRVSPFLNNEQSWESLQ